MAIYKAVINGMAHGQKIVNNLYYRTGIGFELAGLEVGGAKALAASLKAQVAPKMLDCLPSSYEMVDITVYPYDDGSFNLLYQNPWAEPVAQNGTVSEQTDGVSNVMVLKFNLEPTQILGNGVKPPKRGYIALGPVASAWITDDGHIDPAQWVLPNWKPNVLAAALAGNIESLLPPVVWYPIRVSQMKVLGVFKITSFADVGGCVVRRLASFRRSRQPEY